MIGAVVIKGKTALVKLIAEMDHKVFDIWRGEEVRQDLKKDFGDRNLLETLFNWYIVTGLIGFWLIFKEIILMSFRELMMKN